MEVTLSNLAKRYNKEWIFKDLNFTFISGENYALTGSNGSGKSTLLQIISGYHLASDGKVTYSKAGKKINNEDIFRHLTLATPYMELIEEFTLKEHLDFHMKFRNLRKGQTQSQIIESCLLGKAANKQIKHFSSGMKQRLKLALACFTESDLVLLDEPTSNLDNQGISWYHERMEELTKTDAIVIVASNQEYEYKNFCSKHIDLIKLKP